MVITALVMAICSPAQGAIVTNVSYSYFNVSGNTPAEIYRAILSRGPQVSGSKALASIATTATQGGRMEKTGGSCRAVGYTIKLNIVIKRPRIANEQALPPADLQLWRQFSGFIKAHEEQHKDVWLSCAADLERKVKAVSAPSCAEASAKVKSLWKQMLARCDKTHRSYDAAQSRALMKQPFMQQAVRVAKGRN